MLFLKGSKIILENYKLSYLTNRCQGEPVEPVSETAFGSLPAGKERAQADTAFTDKSSRHQR